MRMSKDLPIHDLSGLALDWLIGEPMGYNLQIPESGARVGKFTLNSTKVYKDNGKPKEQGRVIKLLTMTA